VDAAVVVDAEVAVETTTRTRVPHLPTSLLRLPRLFSVGTAVMATDLLGNGSTRLSAKRLVLCFLI
jgi:hypothetical protein